MREKKRFTKQSVRTDQGFTFVEALVSIFIIGCIALGIVHLTTTSSHVSMVTRAQSDLIELQSVFYQHLRFDRLCTEAIQKTEFLGLNRPTPLNFDLGKGVIGAGFENRESGYSIQDLYMDNITPHGTLPSGNSVFAGSVKMKGEKVIRQHGNYERPFLLPLGGIMLEIDSANRIVRCLGRSETEDTCVRLGGTYDGSAAQPCQIPIGSCNTDEIPRHNSDGSYSCIKLTTSIGESCAAGQVLVSNGVTSDCRNFEASPVPVECFQTTCESDAGAIKTFRALTDENGVVAVKSPSGGSVWVTQISRSGAVLTAWNCWTNWNVESGGMTPTATNVQMCKDYGARTPIDAVGFHFGRGDAIAQRRCTVTRCNALKSASLKDDQFLYHWAGAEYNAATQTARVNLTLTGWARYNPSNLSVDTNVPKGQCQNRSVSLYDKDRAATRTVNYIICFTSDDITVDFDGQRMTIDAAEWRIL